MVFTSPDKHIKNMPMCGTILMENNWKLAGDVGCLDAWGRQGQPLSIFIQVVLRTSMTWFLFLAKLPAE